MFKRLKPAMQLLPVIVVLGALSSFSFNSNSSSASIEETTTPLTTKLRSKALELKYYATQNGYNTDYCFLADLGIASGKNRFFVYNFEDDREEQAGLVTHGMGLNPYTKNIVFSNETGSLCSSVGKYRMGNAYTGKYGPAYRLHGLDASNNNAFKRCVVLHGYDCVPDDEVYPAQICKSEGCPMVSPAFFETLQSYIDESEKPVLMMIYN